MADGEGVIVYVMDSGHNPDPQRITNEEVIIPFCHGQGYLLSNISRYFFQARWNFPNRMATSSPPQSQGK